ncbi:duboraya isoform X2 [Cottoperca gobio]|uniref:Duboraya isoform X2 n=1 Tax=Cottoperca gobio TaxID=56716 RepID=A0A6J2R1J6_COTGO|nr:capZ-interacting protein-like isoform X2 [Cottoperca gobio]
MEEEAPSRRSVTELASRFKGSAPPHDASGSETEKPVRRRPPRSLQLHKTHGDDQEPPGVISPTKAKRNSALIEKLQANLALSPSPLLPSPKSPGFRLRSPFFAPPSPGSTLVTTVTTSSTAGTPPSPTPATAAATSPLTEEEGPASFEAPPTAGEGSILSNTNIKGRARHSIRRRPPSRRHRKSSSGDEVGVAFEGGDVSPSPPAEPEDKTTAAAGVEEAEGEADAATSPEKNESHEEEKVSVQPRGGEEKKKGAVGGGQGDGSSGRKREENSAEKQKDESSDGATDTDRQEEEKTGQSSTLGGHEGDPAAAPVWTPCRRI